MLPHEATPRGVVEIMTCCTVGYDRSSDPGPAYARPGFVLGFLIVADGSGIVPSPFRYASISASHHAFMPCDFSAILWLVR